jgi:hypothetical protein
MPINRVFLTPQRAERLRVGVTLQALSVVSGVPATLLSEAERELRSLTPVQEEARKSALTRLAIFESPAEAFVHSALEASVR